MSSDILTSAQHWIEEPSEIIGEETAVQFPYFGLGINLQRCYGGSYDQGGIKGEGAVWRPIPTQLTHYHSVLIMLF